MARRSVRAVLALLAAVAALAVAPSAAHAAGELHLEVEGGSPLVDLDHLAPGSTWQSKLSATNTSTDDGELALRVVALEEDDNGCVGPETADGDHTCGDGGGELGRDITVAILPLDAGGLPDGPAVFHGTLRDLVAWTTLDPLLPAGVKRSFRLDWALSKDSPNDTQSDTVTFDLEVVLEQIVPGEKDGDPQDQPRQPQGPGATVPGPAGTPPRPEVAGTSETRATTTTAAPRSGASGTSEGGSGRGRLPRTGLDTAVLVELGAVSVVTGVVLRTAARRRRRSS